MGFVIMNCFIPYVFRALTLYTTKKLVQPADRSLLRLKHIAIPT